MGGSPLGSAELAPVQYPELLAVVGALRQQTAVLQRSVKRPELRDSDRIDGSCFSNRARSVGIEEVLVAPRPPWRNPPQESVN